MTQPPLAAVLTDLTAPLAASLGLELWGIELAFGGRSLVRVFVESDNGVTVEQCAELSRLLGLSLDVEDIIPGAYVLEVSSPGLERTFFTESQFARATGQRVEITLHQPLAAWPGRRKFRGMLQKAPGAALPDEQERGPENAPASDAPNAPETGAENSDSLFLLQAEDVARPGDEAPLIAFAFADLKKAVQVHFFSEQAPLGKASGKKKPGKKSANTSASEQENSDETKSDPDAQKRGADKKERKAVAKAPRNLSEDKAEGGPDTEFTE